MTQLIPLALALALLAAVPSHSADVVRFVSEPGTSSDRVPSMAELPAPWQQQLGPLLGSPDVTAAQLQAVLVDLEVRSPLEEAAAARHLGQLALELQPSLGNRVEPLARAAARARDNLDEAQRRDIDRALQDTARRLGLPAEAAALEGGARLRAPKRGRCLAWRRLPAAGPRRAATTSSSRPIWGPRSARCRGKSSTTPG